MALRKTIRLHRFKILRHSADMTARCFFPLPPPSCRLLFRSNHVDPCLYGTLEVEGKEHVWDEFPSVSTHFSGGHRQPAGEGERAAAAAGYPTAAEAASLRAIELHVKINMGFYGDGLEAQGPVLAKSHGILWRASGNQRNRNLNIFEGTVPVRINV